MARSITMLTVKKLAWLHEMAKNATREDGCIVPPDWWKPNSKGEYMVSSPMVRAGDMGGAKTIRQGLARALAWGARHGHAHPQGARCFRNLKICTDKRCCNPLHVVWGFGLQDKRRCLADETHCGVCGDDASKRMKYEGDMAVFCDKHHERVLKYGTTGKAGGTRNEDKKCSVEGCPREVKSLGMCKHHYNRQRYESKRERRSDTYRADETRKCEKCGRKHYAKGLCNRCYQNQRNAERRER